MQIEKSYQQCEKKCGNVGGNVVKCYLYPGRKMR
jgi:hypothetical protein